MQKAVLSLNPVPQYLLIDGITPLNLEIEQKLIAGGDGLSFSIAAASILAKVTRDRIMDEMHLLYPDYGFNRHKGYPTQFHLEKITRFGPCPIHRRSFRGVVNTSNE
jgi:ribonuclease HII